MKKIISLFLTIALTFSVVSLCGCDKKTEQPEPQKDAITVAMPDGAPVLSCFSIMDGDKVIDGHEVKFNVLSGKQNIASVVTSGAADVAVMPTNVAAKLYNKGVKIKLLSVNVYGVLYMIGQTPIEKTEDLIGKIVYNIGEGGTPDLVLKYILDKKGIPYVESETPVEDKVALSYVADAQTAVANVKKNAGVYGVVGEPVASNAVLKVGAKIVMDMQAEFKALSDSALTQAGVVVSEKVYNDKTLLAALFEELNKNPAYIIENAGKVRSTINACGSALEVDFNADIITRCNLKCVSAKDAKSDLEGYFGEIAAYDDTFIGGKKPDDNFYLG